MPLPVTPDSRRRHLLAGLAMACGLHGLTACRASPNPPLTIAAHIWPGYEFLYLAVDQGWLPGERIKLQETGSATDSMNALRNGRVHGAALTLDEALRLRAEGVLLNVVLVFDVSAGADVVVSRPHLRQLGDLAGKRIGVESSALGAVMLALLLEHAGLAHDQVKVISITSDNHLTAWQAGQFDALITYEPTASQLLTLGARRLLDSRSFPGRIFDVLAVRSDLRPPHTDDLRQLIAAHFRAQALFRQSPSAIAERLAPRLGLSTGEVNDLFLGLHLPDAAENRQLLQASGALQEAATSLQEIMRRHRLPGDTVSLVNLSDPRFLPAAD